jgi:hypothetical protein
MLQELAIELNKRKLIHEVIDRIIMSHFTKHENCHIHVRRSVVQEYIRKLLNVTNSYQFRRVVTDRMAHHGFKPVQLHGRPFYKYVVMP